jgi:hypothetical protein
MDAIPRRETTTGDKPKRLWFCPKGHVEDRALAFMNLGKFVDGKFADADVKHNCIRMVPYLTTMTGWDAKTGEAHPITLKGAFWCGAPVTKVGK